MARLDRCVLDLSDAMLAFSTRAGPAPPRTDGSRLEQDVNSARRSLVGERWFDNVPACEPLAQHARTGLTSARTRPPANPRPARTLTDAELEAQQPRRTLRAGMAAPAVRRPSRLGRRWRVVEARHCRRYRPTGISPAVLRDASVRQPGESWLSLSTRRKPVQGRGKDDQRGRAHDWHRPRSARVGDRTCLRTGSSISKAVDLGLAASAPRRANPRDSDRALGRGGSGPKTGA